MKNTNISNISSNISKMTQITSITNVIFYDYKKKLQFKTLFKVVLLLVSLVMLNGCITNPKGNFVSPFANFNQDYKQQVAQDFARQLALLYNPADTTFIFSLEVNDYFGKSLIANLRGLGFAIQEISNENLYTTNFNSQVTRQEKEQIKLEYARAKKNPYQKHLRYAVIPINQDNKSLNELYQVTIYIDNYQRLSRLWQVNFDHLTLQTSLHASSLYSISNK